jgi:predicted HicB family RNase H-like nuclease
VIEWSDEDECFVGSAPPLVGQCCHGRTEAEVARQLAVIVDDLVEDALQTGGHLPASSKGKHYSGNFMVRIPPAVHQKTALKAMARGESLNQYVTRALAKA